jgi:ABC-type bacteriocin/lantibiotic exporter with double-glycine peptidase domain
MHNMGPYLQDPEQCGPYALASLLEYMGIMSDPADLARKLYSPGAGGTLTMDLFLEARRQGLEARQVKGSAGMLKEELKDHNPVIVLFKYSGLRTRTGHFVLVTGFSDYPPGFFLLWGDGKLSWMKQEEFEHLWANADSWMLTVRAKR